MTNVLGFSIAFARDMIPADMKSYSASLPPIYEKYGGSYLAIGGPGRGIEWLTGDWSDRMIMVGMFPSRDAVGAFWWGPEYRHSATLRKGAVTVDVAQVSGTNELPQPEHTHFLLVAMASQQPWLPTGNVTGSAVLVAAGAAEVAVLEGELPGLSLTLVGCTGFATAQALWASSRDRLEMTGAKAGIANRAPTK